MRTPLALVTVLALGLAGCGEGGGATPAATTTAQASDAAATAAPDPTAPDPTATATPAESASPTPSTSAAPSATPSVAAKGSASAAAGAGLTKQQAAKIAHDRHERFEEMGDTFKAVTDEFRKDSPDVAKIQAGAAKIHGISSRVRTWFPAGSGPQAGIKTDALQTIWTKPAEFRQANDRFETQAAAFHTAAQAGDLAALRTASRSLGGACKNCHDQFREED